MFRLRDRLTTPADVVPADRPVEARAPAPAPAASGNSRAYQQMKARVHELLLGRLDLEAMERLSPEQLRTELNVMVERLLSEENVVVNAA